jgi:uncharacterized OsmC-like protein
MLGFEVAQSTVSKYMLQDGPPSQSWKTFLRNHAQAIATIDLCVVPTLTFESPELRFICPSLPRRSIHGRKEVMVVVREKTTVTQRIHDNCPTHSRTEISVRDVKTVIDEPKEREVTNMGPTPTETMVAVLIACTNVISHKCAKRHGVELKAMTIDAESTLDRRGTQLLEEIEVPFPKIRLLIDVTADASEADLER